MRLVCFEPFRCEGISDISDYLKPDQLQRHRDAVMAADWVLFPPSWLVNTLIYAMKRRVFPSPATYHLGYDKIQQTRAFLALCPEHTPDTQIQPVTPPGIDAVLEHFAFPIVAKRPRDSMGKGVALIEDAAGLRAWAAQADVLYVQEYLPIDRDLRVVWVGDRVVTAYWRIAAEGAFHNNVSQGGSLSFDAIPEAALVLVERVARALGLDHAGFDVAMVDGYPFLLEFNLFFGNEALNLAGIRIGPYVREYLERC